MSEPTPDTQVPPDPANGAAPADEVASLRQRAEQAERERDQYLALVKSSRAEFENYQKRARKDEADRARYAHFDFALGLLPVLDNLERATAAAEKFGETGPLVQGVEQVRAQFLAELRRHGVTRIEAHGQLFDPNLHQALMQQPSAEHPPGTVVNVFEPGYLIHDRVLRPAQVAVSVAPPSGG
jgi:molecular chaperone GrpE